MFKQFKITKALTLLGTIAISGQVFAPTPPGGTGGGAAAAAAATGLNASNFAVKAATTSGTTVSTPAIITIETTKALSFIEAVTAEAHDAMKPIDASAAPTADGGIKVAGASGSQHRASTWLRASMGALDNKTTDQSWNGQSYLLMAGADYRFNNVFCAGLGLSYNRMDLRTEFNQGTIKKDTFGINPYLIMALHKNFNIVLAGGASWAKSKDERNIINGTTKYKFTASPKTQSMFGGVFANFINKIGKGRFSAQVGYVQTQSKVGAFNETAADSRLSDVANKQAANTFKAGTVTGKVMCGYHLTPSVMPYLTLHAQYDAQQNKGVTYDGQPEIKVGRSAFGGGTGLNFKGDDAVSGSLGFDYTKRGDLSTYVGGLRVHYSF